MNKLPFAKRYLVPVRRLFPIWRYEPIHWNADDMPDAFAWCPGWYGAREISREDAVRLVTA